MKNRAEASSTAVLDENKNSWMVQMVERVMSLDSRVVPILASFDHNLELTKTDWQCAAFPWVMSDQVDNLQQLYLVASNLKNHFHKMNSFPCSDTNSDHI